MTKQITIYSIGLCIYDPNNLVEVETVIRPTLPIVPNYAYYLHEDKPPYRDWETDRKSVV